MSTRALLRTFQRIRAEHARAPGASESFEAELALLQHKDLDLSVRLGALLAFDVLLLTAVINPIAASPGAPLSLDAARQPWETWAVLAAVALLSVSAFLCVRAVLLGEEFDTDGIEDDPQAIVQRWFAAYCASVDSQVRLLRLAARFTIAGGAAAVLSFLWIIIAKMAA